MRARDLLDLTLRPHLRLVLLAAPVLGSYWRQCDSRSQEDNNLLPTAKKN